MRKVRIVILGRFEIFGDDIRKMKKPAAPTVSGYLVERILQIESGYISTDQRVRLDFFYLLFHEGKNQGAGVAEYQGRPVVDGGELAEGLRQDPPEERPVQRFEQLSQ